MTHDLRTLTEAEWAVILDLVQRELTELPTEIHHTTRADYRKELSLRRRVLADLLEKLQAPALT